MQAGPSTRRLWVIQNHKNLFKIPNLSQKLLDSLFSLPAALPNCSCREASCSHALPSASRHLSLQASPCSVSEAGCPQATGVFPRTGLEGGCFHFSMRRRLPETWVHSEGYSSCPDLARDAFAKLSGF